MSIVPKGLTEFLTPTITSGKTPCLAAVSRNDKGHPVYLRMSKVKASVGRVFDDQLMHAQFYSVQVKNNKWTTIMNLNDIETHIDPDSLNFLLI